MQDIPKIVVKRLQGMAPTAVHPEANLLTAFAEQSLDDKAERELVLEHLAGCGECRQILELALAVSESEAVKGAFAARQKWVGWPALRWGFATAVAIALVSVGVLQYEHRHNEDRMAEDASRHRQMVPAREPSEPEAPSQAQEPNIAAGSQESVVGAHPALAKSDSQTLAGAGRANTKGMAPPGNVPAIARNGAPDQLIQNQAAAAENQPYTDSDVVKAKAALPAASQESGPAFAPPNIPLQTSPSLMQRASPRWTITATGRLQRSFDAGKTWEDVSVNAETGETQKRVVFHAVAALGPEVWAAGSGAMLYHSSDSGTQWQQVFPFAMGVQPAGDITGIQFSNPQEGKISTSAGEVWTTSDNGRTWQKQQKP